MMRRQPEGNDDYEEAGRMQASHRQTDLLQLLLPDLLFLHPFLLLCLEAGSCSLLLLQPLALACNASCLCLLLLQHMLQLSVDGAGMFTRWPSGLPLFRRAPLLWF